MFGLKEVGERLAALERTMRPEQLPTKEEVAALASDVRDVKSQLEHLQQRVGELDASLPDFSAMNEDFEAALEKFRTRTRGITDFERQLGERLSNETAASVEKKLSLLDGFLERYEELRRTTEATTGKVRDALAQLEKLNRVAGAIRERDFTLATHERNLRARDSEIRRLEKENERLQRLVARRRGRDDTPDAAMASRRRAGRPR